MLLVLNLRISQIIIQISNTVKVQILVEASIVREEERERDDRESRIRAKRLLILIFKSPNKYPLLLLFRFAQREIEGRESGLKEIEGRKRRRME